MIRGEKLNLHSRRSIWASCRALELERRDEDFPPKKSVFFRNLKNLSELSCLMAVGDRHYLLGYKRICLEYGQSLTPNPCEDPDSGQLANPARVWTIAYSSNCESLYRGGKKTCCGRPEEPLWFGHGWSGHRMLLEHERNYGLGMDALISVCSRRTRSCGVRRRKSESA